MKRKSKQIICGNVAIGGDAPITIQSMTNTNTKDINKTIAQIKELEKIGCEIIRVAVVDLEDALAIKEIKKNINIPIVADIHFDFKLALVCIDSGVDKIRINPGNIGSIENIKKVVKKAKEYIIPIRIGVNSGSIEKEILKKYHGLPTAEGLVDSALQHVKILEDLGFYDIAISVKASDVKMCVEAYRLLAKKVDYPLHIGVTEAGTLLQSAVKSSIGIGSLLLDGIGDTIRVSITDNPIEEIKIAKYLLNSLSLRKFGYNLISCPTCGRCNINLIDIVKKLEKRLENYDTNMTIAIMGCVVNGPGEASHADIGIAGGNGQAVLFKKGQIIKTFDEKDIIDELITALNDMKDGIKID